MDDRNTGRPDTPSILREVAGEDWSGTHSSQCWTWHPGCALHAAADEIERLRALSDQLAEALHVQCGLHRIPVATRPYYTQHAKDALRMWQDTVPRSSPPGPDVPT